MKKSLTKGLKSLFVAGTLSLIFAASATNNSAEVEDAPSLQSQPDTLSVIYPLLQQEAQAPAVEEESVIPISGPVLPWTRPLVASGTLDLVRAGIAHYNAEAPGKPIILEINSPGGDVTTMFSVLNAMAMSKNPVNTRCIGYAASAGAFILMSGKAREAWSSCNILVHNVQIQDDSAEGMRAGADIIRDNISRNSQLQASMKKVSHVMVRETGLPAEVVDGLLAQDCSMPVEAAKALNVIDMIIDPRDPKANERKFAVTADNICIGVHLPDDLTRRIRAFTSGLRPARP